MSKFHRLSRLLEMLEMIHLNRNLRAKDLSEHFGVSEKRIYDDIAELNIAGIPVVFENRGYRIFHSHCLSMLNLEDIENRNLFMALRLMDTHGPSTDNRNIGGLQQQIAEEIPEPLRESLSRWEEQTYIKETGTPKVPRKTLHTIFQALESEQLLKVEYFTASRQELTERMMAPYLLAFAHDAWYLIAWCHREQQIKTFKLARFQKANLTGKKFVRQEDFSAESYFKFSWGIFHGKIHDVEIEFDHSVAPYILEKDFQDVEISNTSDRGVRMKARVRGLEEISRWVLQYGCHAKALSPPEFVEIMKKEALKMNALYSINDD